MDLSFCTFGSGPGQCNQPAGVAVDETSGRVYVADNQNDRVNVFSEDGVFITSFGTSGSGPGQLSRPWSVAVDNDSTSPAFHDVYVVDANLRVQRFSPAGAFVLTFGSGQVTSNRDPIAVGSGGTVYLGTQSGGIGRIVKFSPAGTSLGVSTLQGGGPSGMALDSSGDAYVLANQIEKYELTEPAATLLGQFDAALNTRSLAVNSEDHLFAAQIEEVRMITERDSSGQVIKRFGYEEIQFNLNGLAAGAGRIFGSEEYVGSTTVANRVFRIAPPPPGPVACCILATPGNTKATLKGKVNPEGKATTYHFDYVDDEAFKSGGFSNPAVKSTPETPVGSDFTLHGAAAQVGCVNPEFPPQPSCLKPATLYHYRLVAINADGKSEEEGTFTTLPPFEVTETYATEVGTDAAHLHATVNPFGIPATGYFEYVDDAAYQEDLAKGEGHDGFAGATKAPGVDAAQTPVNFGSGEAPKAGSAELFSLKAGTTYHYRLIVTDPFVTVPGQEHTITTFPVPSPPSNACPNTVFRSGPSARLPDCRAYEMVSPVDKNGGEIKVLGSTINHPARFEKSADDGSRYAFSSITSFGDALSAPWTSEYIATRHEGEGWSTHGINPARESTSLTQIPPFKWDVQYKTFSDDLASGWLIHDTNPALDSCAPEGVLNLYRRDNATDSYEALTIAEPTDVPSDGYELELQGLSADGSHAAFRANGTLTADAATKGLNQLYMHVKNPGEEGCGELRLISVLPNGSASPRESSLGTFTGAPGESRENTVSHAVSADGTLVFWSTTNPYVLYARDMEAEKTVQIAAGGFPQFWNAAADGSKVLYAVGGSLFEFDTAKGLAGEPASTLIAPNAEGVAGASEDLSRIYFASTAALGGEGEAGKFNLYLYDAGTVTFIATLRGDNENGPSSSYPPDLLEVANFPAIIKVSPVSRGVRVPADGAHMAFVSRSSLTGYDNLAADGTRAYEVYLYDAGADRLACISCNPTEARPAAKAWGLFGSTEIRRVSAHMGPVTNQFFAPRNLSADGNHLFFNSYEALVARDTNGRQDVYEWLRAQSQAECDANGAELYVSSAGGCLSLISTGQNEVDSEFADASPGGSDVFIRTSSSLLPQDPGQMDVYDARANGGLPQPPAPPAVCEGEACQGPLAPPNDPTPASSAFEGAGNAVAKPAKKKKAAKKKQRKKSNGKSRKQAKHKRGAGR